MEKLRCEKLFNDQVWKLVLDDPKGNVVDGIMLKSFDQVFDEAAQDKHCKLIILQGEGKHRRDSLYSRCHSSGRTIYLIFPGIIIIWFIWKAGKLILPGNSIHS